MKLTSFEGLILFFATVRLKMTWRSSGMGGRSIKGRGDCRVALAVFHIYTALLGPRCTMQRSIHLGLGLILVFWFIDGWKRQKKTLGTLDIILILATAM